VGTYHTHGCTNPPLKPAAALIPSWDGGSGPVVVNPGRPVRAAGAPQQESAKL